MMGLFDNLNYGFSVALSLENLFYCALGVTLGTFVGVLPGIGALATIAMLLPLTFDLSPVAAIIMLSGIYYGAMTGGSTTSILLNIPGTAAHAVTCIDGHPMAKSGRAASALVITAVASIFAGMVATFVIASAAPALSVVAINFSAPEYFSLMVLGLVGSSGISDAPFIRSISMVFLGLLMGVAGADLYSGIPRFSFGMIGLWDGVHFIVLSMGIFGFAEIVNNLSSRGDLEKVKVNISWRDMIPKSKDLADSWKSILRGTTVGSVLGPIPAAGAALSSFVAYAVEKRCSASPERFGKGAIEGVAAPEAANNAAAQTAYIPNLTLGIPGDAVGALMLGALMIHGISPGPTIITQHGDLFWGLVASMFIGNFFLIFLNLPLVGLWIRMLSIPYRILYPAVLIFIMFGVYSVNNSLFDVILSSFFGILGYVFIKLKCPVAPLLLGFILAPMMEENFRRAMQMSRGDLIIFIDRPLSLSFLIATLLFLAVVNYKKIFNALGKEVRGL